jgi:hypothetical protein
VTCQICHGCVRAFWTNCVVGRKARGMKRSDWRAFDKPPLDLEAGSRDASKRSGFTVLWRSAIVHRSAFHIRPMRWRRSTGTLQPAAGRRTGGLPRVVQGRSGPSARGRAARRYYPHFRPVQRSSGRSAPKPCSRFPRSCRRPSTRSCLSDGPVPWTLCAHRLRRTDRIDGEILACTGMRRCSLICQLLSAIGRKVVPQHQPQRHVEGGNDRDPDNQSLHDRPLVAPRAAPFGDSSILREALSNYRRSAPDASRA